MTSETAILSPLPSITTISPIQIHSPGIIIIAFLLVVLARIYPTSIQPRLLLLFSTTSKQRVDFHKLYTEYCNVEDQAKEIDGQMTRFAEHALLRRRLIKLEIQLQKFPRILYKQYPPRPKYQSTMYDEDGGNGSVFGGSQDMFQRMPQMESVIVTQLLSFFPILIVFLMYLVILMIWGWDYTIYEFRDFSHIFDKPLSSPSASSSIHSSTSQNTLGEADLHRSIIINGIYALSYIFESLPGVLVYTLQATTTSFIGLYYLLGRVVGTIW